MKIKIAKVAELILDPDNARRHGDIDIEAIATSLERFGQQTPIVITADKLVIKGNGTLMAAMSLGWTKVKVVQTTLTGDQLRAYAIADNQTGLLSEWNVDRLQEKLDEFEEAFKHAMHFELPPLKPPTEPKNPKPKKEKTSSIHVENVPQSKKDLVLELIMEVIQESGNAYSAAAY